MVRTYRLFHYREGTLVEVTGRSLVSEVAGITQMSGQVVKVKRRVWMHRPQCMLIDRQGTLVKGAGLYPVSGVAGLIQAGG